ncbi:nucleotidyl transferase AbiEii/AbiGii toxin family protein [Teredinibacter turnerae]|uniref:nucleotidyl transferase AbiEii/AbiGii toxin family protein n=1 Tax=Teredinibacter turnerae TaxID=2426 RepID=UPI00048DBC73|nr:nucleotidyl transferase AbiEii/AbiGii toxin family protein [Teredinibacter turnerae]
MALSRCWKVIDRFSEGIDLFIHWVEMEDEPAARQQTNNGRCQQKNFRGKQTACLTEWCKQFVEKLKTRLGVRYFRLGSGA